VQRRIGDVLDAFDQLVEINQRRIEVLQGFARSLYRKWFIDAEREELTLAEVASITMGQSPKSAFYNDAGDGVPFHQGVTGFGTLIPVHSRHCTADVRVAMAQDVLCSVRAPVGRLNIADAMLGIGRGLAAIRRVDDAQAFLLFQLREALGEVDSIGGGTIFKAIGKAELSALSIKEPSKGLVQHFEEMARPMLELRIGLTLLNRQLAATRDLLLSRLVTGRINVSAIDLKALASVRKNDAPNVL
jgi:type I restriction enzyme S subunit